MAKFVNFNGASSMRLPGGESSFFSRIQSAGSKMSTSSIIIISAVILFSILTAFYFYYYVINSNVKSSYKPNSENVPIGTSQSSTAELLFFYADWCPHCKAAKPIWNELKNEYQNKTVNGYQVIFTEVDCTTESDETDKMMNQYNVEGYPTIKLLKDGQVIEYDAKPSKETLNQFLNTVL
jgi:thiol-disulfide isomerase/thioredoxin